MKVLGVTLQKTPLELESIIPRSFIQEVSQPCRLERITHSILEQRGLEIYLDVCHNEQGFSYVLSQLNRKSSKPIFIVYGCSSGKKVSSILEVMERYSDRIQGVYCV